MKANPLDDEFIAKTFGTSESAPPPISVKGELAQILSDIQRPGITFEQKRELRARAEQLVGSMVKRSPSGAPLG